MVTRGGEFEKQGGENSNFKECDGNQLRFNSELISFECCSFLIRRTWYRKKYLIYIYIYIVC